MLELGGHEIASQTIFDLKQSFSAARWQTFTCISIYLSCPLCCAALVLAPESFATLFADEVCKTNCSLENGKLLEDSKEIPLHCSQLPLKFQHVACHLPMHNYVRVGHPLSSGTNWQCHTSHARVKKKWFS